ncbi:hypothetical protein CCICO_01050 [Corynebacterium ciconiae DSM 44920]|uniref:hypothetical protein n=1 Tax=Corynebacterium ciconiae TaxID=227319 RepID=UPI0003638A66|nr:hypothetical protein [Corynebacterium ciconiae]WKD60268.1 hypothetical protein CCICO_01050 [Corynebacterium ciconiae DSM 44920]
MNRSEAQEILDLVRQIDERATARPRSVWVRDGLLSVLAGVGLICVLQQLVWLGVILFLLVIGLALAKVGDARGVRRAVKQDQRQLPTASWKRVWFPILVNLPVLFLPRGNLALSVVVGVVAAGFMLWALTQERKASWL